MVEVGISLAALLTHAWGQSGNLAALAGVLSWGYILVLALSRLLLAKVRRNPFPNLWNHTAALYGLQWLFTVLLFRSAIIHQRSQQSQILMIADFILATLLGLIAITSRRGNKVVLLEYEDDLPPSREPLASLLSLATFGWVDAIIWQGYKKTFELTDVWNLAPKDKAANVLADFRQATKASYLAWRLLKYFRRSLIIQYSWAALSGLFTFAPTLLLKAILEYIENPDETPANAAWFFVVLLALSGCVTALGDGQALWIGRKICIRLRAIVIGEIYAKALRRKVAAGSDTVLGEKKNKTADKSSTQTKNAESKQQKDELSDQPSSDSQVNVGTIINLMAVDSFKVSEVGAYLHFLWASVPIQIIVAIVLLYRILGLSSIAGIGTMFMLLPLNIYLAKQFNKTQKKIMAATDGRIQTTNEVLSNIRIIKYFAWEERFGQIVDEKRAIELRALRARYVVWSFAAIIWYGAPLIITFFSFMIYTVVEKKDLIPSIAFTSLSLFGILRYPLDQLADMLTNVQESKVSIDRVEEFLKEDETGKYDQLATVVYDEVGEVKIGFDRATFTWGSKDAKTKDGAPAFRMIDLDFRFRVGRLNIVAGPTGSGKTSLLMALLGEMTMLSGAVFLPGGHSREDLRPNLETNLTESVAYCAQQAWLVNDTIKQNIVFASPWDRKRYESVIEACALKRDLEILDAGDKTLVGEKGITLSGGQKQRISLARALYCDSRHVLLDDCLSAVDSHTAKHIFEYCIMGPLMLNRTCILVTHNVALCVPQSHYVVVLANGKISIQGSPDLVMSSGALGEDILTSRPTSKGGTQAHSRVQSNLDLAKMTVDSADANDAKPDGELNRSVETSMAKPKVTEDDETTKRRAESKAEGSVKWDVIKMYLAAMGPWYFWVIILAAFGAQQLGSVATNVWIRQWANSYHTRRVYVSDLQQNLTTMSHVHPVVKSYSSGCLLSGTCSWVLPTSSDLRTNGVIVSLSEDDQVNVGYYLGIYGLLAVLYLLICLSRFVIAFYGSLIASRKIHTRLLETVTRAQFKFFDTTPLGQIMNRFSKDLQAIDQDVSPVALGLFNCLFSVITIVILISAITPSFLIAGIFLTAIYFSIGLFYINSSRDLKRLESVQRSPLYQQFGETLSGITTIRAYGVERQFVRENQTRVNTLNRPFIYLWSTNRWLALRIDFAGSLVSFFAGVFVILSKGRIDAGAAGLSLTYAVTFNENILWVVRLYAANEQNMNSVERVKEYLDVEQEAPAIVPEKRPSGDWPSRGEIQFIDYTTRYRSDLEPVLKGLAFKIMPSEKVGIVGRTGAGKSSLALALFRGLEADEGKILIDDVDIGQIGLQDLRESITMVPQDPTLFTGTIRSNLDPFSLFTDEEVFTALRRVQLIEAPSSAPASSPPTPVINRDAMPTPPESAPSSPPPSIDASNAKSGPANAHENTNVFTNLSSPVAESGSNLSQGQRQLLCLARALLKNPRILLMDEATASIDYATDAKIQDTLRELRGNTIITIAHRLQTIVDYDKVLVLDKGEVVEYDAPWELLKKEDGIFRGMCEMSGDVEKLQEGAKRAEQQKKLIDV
ncbi:hypothetical protein MMC06_000527 [Schaereria dolodes]|nr:hypothetical protein [Schaereria dolodes]